MDNTPASQPDTAKPSRRQSALKTYRIRGIPLSYDAKSLESHLRKILSQPEGEGGTFAVKSLATATALDSQVATIDVHQEPPILQDTHKDQWTLPTEIDGLNSHGSSSGSLTLDTHFRGLTPLHTALKGGRNGTRTDIVAISGLGGHAFGSFKERGGAHMWLRDTLRHKVPAANIWIYGFDSKVNKSESVQNIDDIANGLLSGLRLIFDRPPKADESPLSRRRLILIGHSLGGLAIKQMLIQLDEHSENISEALRGLLFFGVPSQGMVYKSLLAMSEGGQNEHLLHSLQPNSEVLRSQRRHFKQCSALRQCDIHCFYELRQSPTAVKDDKGKWAMTGPKEHLVSHPSATDHVGELDCKTSTHSIDANHSDMVKFRPHDENADFVFHVIDNIISHPFQREDSARTGNDDRRRIQQAEGSSRGKSLVERDPWSVALYEDPHTWKSLTLKISDYDREEAHRRLSKARISGTTEWFLQTPKVQKWLEDSNVSSLWCSGDIGSGKTMICTRLIDYLRDPATQSDVPLIFFYCEALEYKTTQATYLISSLVRQALDMLIESGRDCPRTVKDRIKYFFKPPGSKPNLSDMIDAFEILHAHMTQCFYVIDGLDQLELEGLSQVTAILNKISKDSSRQKLCVASRAQLSLNARLNFRSSIHLSPLETKTDMKTYIETEVTRKMDEERILTDDPQVLCQIKERLIEQADGMFLWARLQIEALWSDCVNDDQILAALKNLPSDLKTTYDRCVERALKNTPSIKDVGNNAEGITAKTLRWLACARRPLHISELQEAVSYTLTDTAWNPYQRTSTSALNSACANLITIDTASGTVRLTHSSVKQYLSNSESALTDFIADISQADLRCGEECINYLGFQDFKLQLVHSRSAVVPTPPPIKILDRIPHYGLVSWMRGSYTPLPDATHGTISVRLPRQAQAKEEEQYKFLGYARSYWAEHTRSISKKSGKWNEFCDLAIQPNVSWKMHPWVSSGQSQASHLHGLLIWASRERHLPLLQLLLEQSDRTNIKKFCDIPCAQDHLPALHIAARKGFSDVVVLLLKVCNVNTLDEKSQTALHHSVRAGHVDVAHYLLSKGIKDSSASRDDETVLELACSLGSRGIVGLLIDKAAGSRSREKVLSNSFLAAAKNGHSTIILIFLQKCGSSILKNRTGASAVALAATYGHEPIVRLLVERDDVEANAEDEQGRVPLFLAAMNGHESVVRLLIGRSDVNADSRDLNDQTPLSLAAKYGHESVVRLLVERDDVNADSRDIYGQTPLSFAVGNRRESIVRLLVQRADVDANARDMFGKTPAWKAQERGSKAMMRLFEECRSPT